ncbi:MAG TPA: hypothetical protein VIY86_10195 [Pirellulaceae bacterium]
MPRSIQEAEPTPAGDDPEGSLIDELLKEQDQDEQDLFEELQPESPSDQNASASPSLPGSSPRGTWW